MPGAVVVAALSLASATILPARAPQNGLGRTQVVVCRRGRRPLL